MPDHVNAHGFMTVNGEKMSKSRGTGISPLQYLELGMDADLILLDFNQPHLIPCHNVLSQLVYAASGHDVALTMVRGKILYADGKYPTLDIAGALKELHDYAIPRVFSDEPEAQA